MPMADASASKQAGSSSGPKYRPAMKRVRHTWHGETTYRSHFEDFMREIGVDAREHHLCCLPRQATMYTRSRAKSESFLPDNSGEGLSASPVDTDRGRYHKRTPGSRTSSGRPPTSTSTSKSPSVHPLARCTVASSSKASAPVVKLKAQAATCVYTQNHGASSLYPSVPAARGLRFLIRDNTTVKLSQAATTQAIPVDQEPWRPLTNAPALASTKRLPVPPASSARSMHAFSRVPSFASLETISSSEGPETPPGQTPLPSPAHELSPTLSYIEHMSKIRVPASCVTCQKVGHNFPSCPACGDTWCSRECRVRGSQSKRHVCQKTAEPPMVQPMNAVAA